MSSLAPTFAPSHQGAEPGAAKAGAPSEGLAAILSVFVPGLGAIYAGSVFLGTFLLFVTLLGYVFVLPGVVMHFISIIASISAATAAQEA